MAKSATPSISSSISPARTDHRSGLSSLAPGKKLRPDPNRSLFPTERYTIDFTYEDYLGASHHDTQRLRRANESNADWANNGRGGGAPPHVLREYALDLGDAEEFTEYRNPHNTTDANGDVTVAAERIITENSGYDSIAIESVCCVPPEKTLGPRLRITVDYNGPPT